VDQSRSAGTLPAHPFYTRSIKKALFLAASAIGPRGVDAHGAAQEAAVAGLELFINFVVNDHRRWIGRLRCVPVLFSLVKLAWE